MAGRFWPSIRRVDVLPLYHMSTVTTQEIWNHQTLIMLKKRQIVILPSYRMAVNKIHSLNSQQQLIKNKVFVLMKK